ncbi:MAG: outer membrane beta-barrel family protein [Bacteroidota bacterium]
MESIKFTFLYSLFPAFFFISFAVSAQGEQQSWSSQTSDDKLKLIGQIVDLETNAPLEFATFTLFNLADSSIVTGAISDAKGKFVIDAKPGSYFGQVEFISFQKSNTPVINLKKGKSILDLGKIVLSPDVANLAEIEVRAEKSQVQIGLDKKVFNVGQDLANTGGNAADVLDNVPSVSVDIDGNVSLRGSDNVRILVDGRPSGLIGVGDTDGLRQIPANLIDKIEVITNPSARYEAEGTAGILNIILRKERKSGLNGSFDFTTGWPHNHGAAINLNYRAKAVNMFVNYGVNYRKRPGSGSLYQEFYRNDTTFIYEETREHERGGLSNNVRFGADFYITSKDILTAALSYRNSDENNRTDIRYDDYLFSYPDNPVGVSLRSDDEFEDEINLEYSLNYKKTFQKKGQEFTASIQYQENTETEGSDLLEQFFLSEGVPSGIADLQQRSNNKESNKEWLIDGGYVHPFGKKGEFEIGFRSSFRDITNNFLVEEWDEQQWKALANLSNDFVYNEDIQALYMSVGNKHNKFSYQFGLRGEYSDVKTELLQTNEVNDRSYFDLFPSVFFGYDLPKKNAIQVSYSRRIVRPRFWFLNPFFTFSDSRNFFSGNPDLDPEYTHSFEVNHIKYFEKGSFSSSIYYRHSTGVIERIRRIDDEGLTVTRPENLATEDSYGLELTFSYNPYKWWRANGDLNFFRSVVDGTEELGESFQSDFFSWQGRLTSRFTFWKKTDFQVRFNYRAPRESTQGDRQAVYNLDLGLSKDIFKGKGTITLSASDVFNTRRWRYETFGETFYSKGEFQWAARQFTATLNYRLNQKKQRFRGNRGGGGFDGGGMMF